MAGAVLEVFIDADNNKSTGQKTFWEKVPGFKYQVKLLAGINYGDKGSATQGGLTDETPLDFLGSLDVSMCKENKDMCFKSVISSLDEEGKDLSELSDHSISVKIPIAKLGLDSGQKIRIVLRESGSTNLKEGSFFPEQFIECK